MPVIKKNQTLFDYVIQQQGTMESVFSFALQNGLGITDDVNPGTMFQAVEVDNKTTKYFRDKHLDVATDDKNGSNHVQGGIGFMQIGVDFVVS